MRKVTISCFLAMILLYSNNALAKTKYYLPDAGDPAESIKDKYPNWSDAVACAACHYWGVPWPSSANLNPFGLAFGGTHNLSAIAGGDADGDGRSNGVELSAGTLPGLKSWPPGGVAASFAVFADKVRVYWSPAADISGWMPSSLGKTSLYSIYRALESAPIPPDITTSPPLATVSASQTSYDDQTAVTGTKYRYWVSATTPGGQSKTGVPVIGKTKAQMSELTLSKNQKQALMNPKMPRQTDPSGLKPSGLKPSAVKLSVGKSAQISIMAPGHISASDGTYGDKIRVTWGPVPGAVFYRLLRSEGSALGIQSQIATPKITSYDDKGVKPGTKYFYRLISCSAINDQSKCSSLSSPDSGYRKVSIKKFGPSVPAMVPRLSPSGLKPGALKSAARSIMMPPRNIAASDGTYFDKIRVTWAPVPGAVMYRLYRIVEGAVTLGQVSIELFLLKANLVVTTYDDKTAKQGAKYFYRVASCTAYGDLSKCSEPGSPDPGYKSSVASIIKKVAPIAPAMQQKGSTTIRTPGQLSPPVKPGQLLTPKRKIRR